MPRKRPVPIDAKDLVEPIKDKIRTLPKGHTGIQMLEEFVFNKSKMAGFGILEEEHFKKQGGVASHLSDARSVFLVVHEPTGLTLIQKVIHKENNPEVAKLIHNEISILHNCICPEVVQFYGSFIGKAKNEVNIVMEYMDAGCLETVMSRIGRIDEDPLGAIAFQALNGLEYLFNEAKVLHRDIKPSNILVNTKGQVKLCDFGVSRMMSTMRTKIKTFVGTVRYMSPERLTGGDYQKASDIWALGFALIELATGHYPLPVKGIVHDRIAPRRDPRVKFKPTVMYGTC